MTGSEGDTPLHLPFTPFTPFTPLHLSIHDLNIANATNTHTALIESVGARQSSATVTSLMAPLDIGCSDHRPHSTASSRPATRVVPL